ncbi:type II toxin-antitoxin system HicB family antitoxin [Clostridium tepidum]|nr:type II toxin-antitoxin system HicB family antitoxin [Clostridium tepidum]MCR1933537.1 type II toxin-antitoxin system HicB family antitoxin [Clostridium tepidum]
MKKKFTTTIDDELIKKAKIKAIEEGISVAELIEKLLNKYLESTK